MMEVQHMGQNELRSLLVSSVPEDDCMVAVGTAELIGIDAAHEGEYLLTYHLTVETLDGSVRQIFFDEQAAFAAGLGLVELFLSRNPCPEDHGDGAHCGVDELTDLVRITMALMGLEGTSDG